jgi:hypothetical protein
MKFLLKNRGMKLKKTGKVDGKNVELLKKLFSFCAFRNTTIADVWMVSMVTGHLIFIQKQFMAHMELKALLI